MNQKGQTLVALLKLTVIAGLLIPLFLGARDIIKERNKNNKGTSADKTDPCIQYLELAREDMQQVDALIKEQEEKHYNNSQGIIANASLSAMNSSYYLACRDFEKRR